MTKTQNIENGGTASNNKISNLLETFDFEKYSGYSFRGNEYREEAGIWDVVDSTSEFYRPEKGDGHRQSIGEVYHGEGFTREALILQFAGMITREEAKAFDWSSLGTQSQPESVASTATEENGWGELE